MIQVIPFLRGHMAALLQDGEMEPGIGVPLTQPMLQMLERENSWTLIADGRPVVCGGTIELWRGRHQGWAYLNRHTGKYMVPATRKALTVLRAAGHGRIEATVLADFDAGHRWIRMLGFGVETPLLKGYGPEGEDHVGYVRFQE